MLVRGYDDIISRQAAASTLQPVDSTNQSALRFIPGNSYHAHHCVLENEKKNKLGSSFLSERSNNSRYLFIFNALLWKAPHYIASLLNWNFDTYPAYFNDWLKLELQVWLLLLLLMPKSTWTELQHTLRLDTLSSTGQFKTMIRNPCSSPCKYLID